jgi:hypothetical protein
MALAATLVMGLALTALASERRTVTKTYGLQRHEDVEVGVRIGEAKIESFRIHDWPSHEKIEKGERDHDDSTSIKVVFTYSNHDHEHDYKCKYTVELLSGNGKVLGEGSEDRTLDKGKHHDTNGVSLRMHTHRYDDARKVRVTYHMRERD